MHRERRGTSAVACVLNRKLQDARETDLRTEAELEYHEINVAEHRNLHINSSNSFSEKETIP